jgi:cardiolipin synthase
VWSSVGSTNFDWRSFLHNDEVNVVVLGTGFGKKMQAAFMADLAKSNEIKLEKWQRRSLAVKAKEQMALLWEYWL